MTTAVQKIAAQVQALPAPQRQELAAWLAELEAAEAAAEAWDAEIEADLQPGGRLAAFMERMEAEIVAGETVSLDEVFRDE